jgi:hypothetical protein
MHFNLNLKLNIEFELFKRGCGSPDVSGWQERFKRTNKGM